MIGVIGSGSWATEIVHILLEQSGRRIQWWVRDPDKARELQEGNRRLRVSSDIAQVFDACDTLFVVVPSAFLKGVLAPLSPAQFEDKYIVSAVKGFLTDDNLTVTRFLQQTYNVSPDHLCVVSGPSHAEEVARCCLTYLTVASSNVRLAESLRETLACDFLRTVYSSDMQGVECAAALKNLYAIVFGVCYSVGYGDNLVAVLVAAMLKEMARFIAIYTGDSTPRDISDYIYISDLLATCYSQHSRNRTFGELIGRGYSPHEARLMQKMVAEGYYVTRSVEHLRQSFQIEMPVAQTLYRILYEGRGARRELQSLTSNLL